jgi:hypothetical protein
VDTRNGVLFPAVIAAMDYDMFNELVTRSLGRDAPEGLWDMLTEAPLLTRTRDCLAALRTDLQTQQAEANAQMEQLRVESLTGGDEGEQEYLAAKAADAEWRTRLTRYKRLLDRRMALVKSKTPAPVRQERAPYGPGLTITARKHNRRALEQLARAVIAHRGAVLGGDGDDGDDDTLWESLDTITAITGDGEERPLTEWLKFIDALRDDA